MKNFYTFFIMLFIFNIYGQTKGKDLNSELKRLKTKTVLIVQSQGIDEYPIWSPSSDFVACNIQGKWYKFRLTDIELTDAKWREQTIGVLTTENAYSEMTKKEIEEFKKVSQFNPREVITTTGKKVELKMEGFAVSLNVSKKGKKVKKMWTSEGENCHSLVLSPDEKYVAYLCEMNGLLIMKLK